MVDELNRASLFLGIIFIILFQLTRSDGKEKSTRPLAWPLSITTHKVLLTNDGPTTIGGRTTFVAAISPVTGTMYEFCWFRNEYKVKVRCKKAKYNDTFVESNWNSTGCKYVEVEVKEVPHPVITVSNKTTVLVTDTINAKLVATSNSPDGKFLVGPITLSVKIHDPSGLFVPYDIFYYWDFGDGTTHSGINLKIQKHNFTEDTFYNVRVKLYALSVKRMYSGSVTKKLKVTITFTMDAKVIGSPGTKVTTKGDNTYVARGEVTFVMMYNNPYSVVKKTSSDWYFGDEDPPIYGWDKNVIKHNYTKEETCFIWVTPKLFTEHSIYSQEIISKEVTTKEPISSFNVTHVCVPTYNESESLFNVTCKGSGPFEMCWKYIKTGVKMGNSTPVHCLSSQKCSFVINDTEHDRKTLLLSVTVTNYVSSKSIVSELHVNPPLRPTSSPKQSSSMIATETFVSIVFGCLILFAGIGYILKKLYSARHHSVLETADFDFRDEDCRSIDSFKMGHGRRCMSFGFLNGCSKEQESYPLLEHWDSHKRSSLYTEL